MAEFVLENNFFQFNNDVVQQISGTAIGKKFAPPYACIFMDQIETKFLTFESSKKSIACFLYFDVALYNWGLESTAHHKSTNRHKYLPYSSPHLEHTKRSIVFSQNLRVSRICSH